MIEIQILTRKGCIATPAMTTNLEAALIRCGIEAHLVTVDLGTLAEGDPRTGYGSPTVLKDGGDLFGTGQPRPAAPT